MQQPMSWYLRSTIAMAGGIFLECAFNSRHDWPRGYGGTQFPWVPPLYFIGYTAFEHVHDKLLAYKVHALGRGVVYGVIFLGIEYVGGKFSVAVIGKCPWEYVGFNYTDSERIVNFAHMPFWMALGWAAELTHNKLMSLTYIVANETPGK